MPLFLLELKHEEFNGWFQLISFSH